MGLVEITDNIVYDNNSINFRADKETFQLFIEAFLK